MHTEWIVKRDAIGGSRIVELQSGNAVATVFHDKDADVIAAAPDLLEALESVLKDISSGFIANPSVAGERCLVRHEKAITAALKKAKGE